MNRHPQIDLELAVTPAGQEPYTAHVQAYISSIAVPRIQPDCQIDVRVDPDDKQRVILDPALTP